MSDRGYFACLAKVGVVEAPWMTVHGCPACFAEAGVVVGALSKREFEFVRLLFLSGTMNCYCGLLAMGEVR